jgi:Na+/proline symporter
MSALNLVVVGTYLALLIAFGVRCSRRVSGQADFSLAGRGLTLPILLGTLLATWTGTGSIFGQAEEAWRVGLPALILPLAPVLGFLALIVLSTRVRARKRYTLQDLLEERFGPAARVLGTLTLVLAYVVIVSYQFRAATGLLDRLGEQAGLFEATPGPSHGLLAIVALFVGAYTALAGMMSISRTDTFNGVLITIGLLIALPVAWHLAGGWDATLAALPESGRQVGGRYTAFDMLSRMLPTFLLVLGDANLHTRFFSAESDRTARRAAILLIPCVLLIDGAIILLAIAGRALLPDLDVPGHVVLELGLGVLPPLLGALLVATILAIIISTADSYLLSSASALLRDVYQRFVRPDADEARLLRMARVLVMLLTLAALALAFTGDGFFEIALFAYTIYGVGITPPLLAALFWKRATPAGAVASMVTATTTAIVWQAADLGTWAGDWLGQPESTSVGAVLPASLVAGAMLVGVSLCTRPLPVRSD